MSSRQFEEYQERRQDELIAAHLGLTYDEYVSLDPTEILEGDGVTTYRIEFQASIPKSIFKKITVIDDNAVEIPMWLFDETDTEPHD